MSAVRFITSDKQLSDTDGQKYVNFFLMVPEKSHVAINQFAVTNFFLLSKTLEKFDRGQNQFWLHEFCSLLKKEMIKRLPAEFQCASACLPLLASSALEEFVKNSMDSQSQLFAMTFLKRDDYIVCRIQDDGVGFPKEYLSKDAHRKSADAPASIDHILTAQKGKFISDKKTDDSWGGRGKGLALAFEKLQILQGHVYVGNAKQLPDGQTMHGYVELSAPNITYRAGDPLFEKMPIEFQLYLNHFYGHTSTLSTHQDEFVLTDMSNVRHRSQSDEADHDAKSDMTEETPFIGSLMISADVSSDTTPLSSMSSQSMLLGVEALPSPDESPKAPVKSASVSPRFFRQAVIPEDDLSSADETLTIGTHTVS